MHSDDRDDRSPRLPERRARRGFLGVALGSLLGTSGLWRVRAKKKCKKQRCPRPPKPCPARTCCRCNRPETNCTILPGTGDPDAICGAFCAPDEVLVALTDSGQTGSTMACQADSNKFCIHIYCPVV
jgi:hypothetical protein